MKNEENKTNDILFGKYQIEDLISEGSYGNVYLATNIKTKEQYAVKLEDKSTSLGFLEKETYFLFSLKGFGIPKVISAGHSGKYNVLIEQLLGKNLKLLFESSTNKIKDLCMAAIQMIDRIEYVHSKNIIHRDIKPENFLIGNPDSSTIYLIDFGLSRKYRSSRTGKHMIYSMCTKIPCTLMFSSINASSGIEQTRRDDLESLVYTLIYLANGELPWDNVKGKTKYECLLKAQKEKISISSEELCKGLPINFIIFTEYVRSLRFDEEPNYEYLKLFFINSLKEIGEKNDGIFSWVNRNDLVTLKNSGINKTFHTKSFRNPKQSKKERLFKKIEEFALIKQQDTKKLYSNQNIGRINLSKINEKKLNSEDLSIIFKSSNFNNNSSDNINKEIFIKQKKNNNSKSTSYRNLNVEIIPSLKKAKTTEYKRIFIENNIYKCREFRDNSFNTKEEKKINNDSECDINLITEYNPLFFKQLNYRRKVNENFDLQENKFNDIIYIPFEERLKIQNETNNLKKFFKYNNRNTRAKLKSSNKTYSEKNINQNYYPKFFVVGKNSLHKKGNDDNLLYDKKFITYNSFGKINTIFLHDKNINAQYIDNLISFN